MRDCEPPFSGISVRLLNHPPPVSRRCPALSLVESTPGHTDGKPCLGSFGKHEIDTLPIRQHHRGKMNPNFHQKTYRKLESYA
uniref:Uncharacterized protein n=1 Tax=Anguilla anguilla TaxID=7936 RepID=A0A0E9WMT8_ANGAN